MALSRDRVIQPADGAPLRDERADFIAAYKQEYASYIAAGKHDRAAAVLRELKALGVEVKPAPGRKERAVADDTVEKAVEADVTPKRRGRPRKNV